MREDQKTPREGRGSHQNSHRTIGLLIESIAGRDRWYQSAVWAGVADAAQERDANLLCFAGGALRFSPFDEFEAQRNLLYDLVTRDTVDGLIISGSLGSYVASEEYRGFYDRYHPLPLVSIAVPLAGIPSVLVDNGKGMRDMVAHLIEAHGCRRIAFICGPTDNLEAVLRYRVYTDVLAEYGFPLDPNLVAPGDFFPPTGAAAIRLLLDERKVDLDAVVAANDNMALGALEALQERGVHVPGELAVVGFDDIEGAKAATPSLTTVGCPAFEQGKRAAEMLLALLSGREPPQQVILPTKLRVRESCGCPHPAVVRAQVGMATRADRTFKIGLAASRGSILSEMLKAVTDPYVGDTSEQTEQLLNAFYTELKGESPGTFLSALDEILRQVASNGGDVFAWQEAISVIRRYTLPYIGDDQVLFRVEDLWQQARVMIAEIIQRAEVYRRLQLEQQATALREVSETLITTVEVKGLMDVMVRELPRLGIPSCYLSLYEHSSEHAGGEQQMPAELSRLVLAYDEGRRVELKAGGQAFPSRQLVPDGIWRSEKRYSVVIEPLHFREDQLGFVLFEMGPRDGVIYEALRGQISSALKGALLVQEVQKGQEYLRSLYQASGSIISLRDPQAILQDIVDTACDAVGACHADVVLIGQEGQLQRLARGGPGRPVDTDILVRSKSIFMEVMRGNKPLLIEDVQSQARRANREMVETGIGAAGCFPLLVREKPIGVMWVYYTEPHYFSNTERDALGFYANQAAIAYDNARLYQGAHRREQLLTALDEASRHIRAERETSKLLHEVVRLATQLVGCTAGALFINRPHLEELELQAAYGPCTKLVGNRLPHAEGLAGLVARTNKPQIIAGYSDWPEREAMFKPFNFRTVAGVPLEHAGSVNAVLLVADDTGSQRLLPTDLEVLERFATQAAIALQTSQLMGREQRMFSQLDILHRLSDYIQAAKDLDKILHAVLTGVTAGYGLGFNRAALLLLDERQEWLIGRMGIGHLEKSEAERDWARHHEHGRENFGQYLELLEQNGLPLTPVGERIRAVRLPVTSGDDDLFWKTMRERQCTVVTPDELQRLPEDFVKAFGPATPLAIAPLTARGQAIGLLVVDNKFTQSPITPERKEALTTFANTAAIAIDNTQLYQDGVRQIKESEHMRQAAEALAGAASLPEVLHQIVRSAREVLQADSAAIWSYDDVRDEFIPEKSVSSGIPAELWQKFRQEEPRRGRTAYTVMEQGWIAVSDVADTEQYGFLGESTRRLLDHTGVQSFQGIALMVADEKLGVLYVNYNSPRSFHKKEQGIARTFANHAALALKKARLLEQVNKARNAATVVAKVTVLEYLKSTLDSIVAGTQDALGSDAVTLYTYDQDRRKLGYPPVLIGVHRPEKAQSFPEVAKDSIVFKILRLDKPYVAEEATTHRRFKDLRFVIEEEVKSCVGIPLKVGYRKVGVMFVNYRAYHHFTSDELTNLELFANQAAVAIRNAQLYEETNEQTRTLRTLYEAGKVVTGSLTLDETLNRIAQQALNLATPRGQPTHFSYLALVGEKRVHFVAASPSEVLAELKEQVGDIDLESPRIGIIGRVVRTRISENVGDVTQDPNYIPLRFGTRSQLTVPIKIGDQVIGIINVEHSECNAFEKEDQQALEHLAAQATVAIRNARLYDDIKEKVLERTKQLEALQEIGLKITSQLALKDVLGSIVEHANAIMSADFSTLLLYNSDQGRFEDGIRKGKVKVKPSMPSTTGFSAQIAKAQKPVFAADAEKEQGVKPTFVKTKGVKSFAGLPLVIKGKTVGVLYVNYLGLHSFSEEEKETTRLLANQAAVAIENATLFDLLEEKVRERTQQLAALQEEAHERAAILQTVYEAGKVVTSSLTLDEILSRITKQALKLAIPQGPLTHFSYLALVEGQQIHLAAASDPAILAELQEKVSVIDLEQSPYVGITGRAARTSTSQNVGDVTQDSDYISIRSDTCSQLAVPIKIGDRVIGVIDVEHPERNAFDAQDQLALEHLADQAAIAIENARLYLAEQQRIKELSGLNRISQTIRSLTDLQQVYHEINESVAQLVGAEMCAVLLYDEVKEELVCQLPMYGVPDEVGRRYRIPIVKGGDVSNFWNEQDSLILNDVKQSPLVDLLGLRDLANEAGLRDTLLVKLTVGNQNIGIIQASNKLDGTVFNEDDARLLCIFAGQAAAVVENARLYAELKQTRGLIGARTALAWMGMASSAWRHTIDKHALTIREQAQLLRQDLGRTRPRTTETKPAERIATIERLATQILEKPITPPLSTETGLESVSLSALIGERARQLWQNDPYRQVALRLDLQLPDSTTVRANSEWLRRAFDILVDNAVNAVASCEVREITVGTRVVDGGAEAFVSDTGTGIPEEVRAKVGRELIERSEGAKGLGMGLLIAQTIVQAYTGEIRVASTGSTGTTMLIWLPSERKD